MCIRLKFAFLDPQTNTVSAEERWTLDLYTLGLTAKQPEHHLFEKEIHLPKPPNRYGLIWWAKMVKWDLILSEMIWNNRRCIYKYIHVILWFDDYGSISLINNSESRVPIHPPPPQKKKKEKTHIHMIIINYNTTYIQYIYIYPPWN